MSTATHNVNTRRACGSRHFRPTITPRVRKPCRDDSLQFPPVLTTTSLSPAALRPRQDAVRSTGHDETKHIINTKNCQVSVRANLVRCRTKLPGICWAMLDDSKSFCEQFSSFLELCRSLVHISLFLFFPLRCVLVWRAHLGGYQIVNYCQKMKPWRLRRPGFFTAGTWCLRDRLDAKILMRKGTTCPSPHHLCYQHKVFLFVWLKPNTMVNAFAIIFA